MAKLVAVLVCARVLDSGEGSQCAFTGRWKIAIEDIIKNGGVAVVVGGIERIVF